MKRWILAVSFMVLIISTACFSAGKVSESGSKTSSDLAYIFQIPNEPYNVTVTLDPTIQAEATIPASGGSVSVTGADGTTYQLDIPSGALVMDTLIRLIPVTQIDGMPFGSNPVAVQVVPEGLQLYATAILTITPSQSIPIDQQIIFGYQGMGENLVLATPVAGSSEIKIQLAHFSGYGVTTGFLADLASVRARLGGDAEARMQSAMAERLGKARQVELLGAEEDSSPDFPAFSKEYIEKVIKPRIAAAGESCAAGRLAVQTVLGWERQRQLLGVSDDSSPSEFDDKGLLETVAAVCMKEEYELCRDQHIIHRILPASLGLERQSLLLGVTEDGGTTPTLEMAKDYVRRCLTFRLEFHSEGVLNDPNGNIYNSTVDSVVKLQFSTDDMSMHAQAPLVNTTFEFKMPGCKVTSNRGGGTFNAKQLIFYSDTHSSTDVVGYVRDFKLVYDPGITSESFTVKCGDSGSYTSPPSAMWNAIFIPLHKSEVSLDDEGYIADTWEILAGELYAKKEWIKDDAVNDITEVGTFKLYHTP